MKFKKIIFINLLIMICILLSAEMGAYLFLCKQADTKLPFIMQKYKDYIWDFSYKKNERTTDISDFVQPPILLLGCSYAEGEKLSKNENFSAQLTNITHRFVYNYGVAGHGPLTTLLLLKNEGTKYGFIDKENLPDTIIYVYMFSHIQRFGWIKYMYNFMRQQKYFPSQKFNFLYNSHIVQYFQNIIADKEYISNNPEENYKILMRTFKDIKHESDKLFPNSKFIFLIYSDINKDLCEGHLEAAGGNPAFLQKEFDIMYSPSFRHELEQAGMMVVSTEELLGRKMDKDEDRISKSIDPNYPHPSAKAWETITPLFVKKFEL